MFFNHTLTFLWRRVSHSGFMNYAAIHKDSKAAVRFLESLPKYHHSGALYNQALEVCAVSRDLESGIFVREMCEASRHPVTVQLLTTLIKGELTGRLSTAAQKFALATFQTGSTFTMS